MKIPRILWGPAFDRVLDFRLPMHAPMPRRRWFGDVDEAPSGERESWRVGLWPELEWEQRRIPPVGDATQSGWYGATGVEAFLVAARDQEPFRVYLDRDVASYHTCQLVEAEERREGLKAQFYAVRMHVRDVNGIVFEV